MPRERRKTRKYDTPRPRPPTAKADARRAAERKRAFMPYRDFLKTGYWRQLRERVLSRDHRRCTSCGVGEPDAVLNVHHKTYDRRGYERLTDLITLCRYCHHAWHERGEDGLDDRVDILSLRHPRSPDSGLRAVS